MGQETSRLAILCDHLTTLSSTESSLNGCWGAQLKVCSASHTTMLWENACCIKKTLAQCLLHCGKPKIVQIVFIFGEVFVPSLPSLLWKRCATLIHRLIFIMNTVRKKKINEVKTYWSLCRVAGKYGATACERG